MMFPLMDTTRVDQLVKADLNEADEEEGDLLESLNEALEVVEDSKNRKLPRNRKKRGKCAMLVARELRMKVQFNTTPDNAATRKVLFHMGVQIATRECVRKIDMHDLVSIAIEYYFIPTESDIEVASIRAGAVRREREELHTVSRTTKYAWWFAGSRRSPAIQTNQ